MEGTAGNRRTESAQEATARKAAKEEAMDVADRVLEKAGIKLHSGKRSNAKINESDRERGRAAAKGWRVKQNLISDW